MKEIHLLDRRQLRILGDPVRQEILSLLCDETLSTGQLAERLTAPPSNLYYHVDRLRRVGLIRVARRRRVRGTTERFYQAIARAFTVPPALLRTGRGVASELSGTVSAMAETVLARFHENVAHGLLGSGPGQVVPMVTHLTVRATPARMMELRERLAHCLRAFHEEPRAEDATAEEYVLFDLFFPLAPAHAERAPSPRFVDT